MNLLRRAARTIYADLTGELAIILYLYVLACLVSFAIAYVVSLAVGMLLPEFSAYVERNPTRFALISFAVFGAGAWIGSIVYRVIK